MRTGAKCVVAVAAALFVAGAAMASAQPEWKAPADAKAMKCTAGVRTAPMGAGWTWNTLADSAFSHHIPSLAPAVALPAPRHDRRRTGAAGSPPGGFPFVESPCDAMRQFLYEGRDSS